MGHFRTLEQHKVFPVVRKGNTIVVSPAGDAGSFTGVEFQGELNQIIKVFADGHVKNAVVDLSGSNYYGSEMIGALNHLGNHVKSHGGRFAICEASPDMREGLRIMKLDTVWPLYHTRKQAVRAVRRESAGQWLWGLIVWLLVLGLAALVGIAVVVKLL